MKLQIAILSLCAVILVIAATAIIITRVVDTAECKAAGGVSVATLTGFACVEPLHVRKA